MTAASLPSTRAGGGGGGDGGGSVGVMAVAAVQAVVTLVSVAAEGPVNARCCKSVGGGSAGWLLASVAAGWVQGWFHTL